MERLSHIRKFENFHILLWLVKDLCWVTLSKAAGVIMIAPTLSLALFITWRNKDDRAELMHNIAICMWICANSIWMIGEFFLEDSTRQLAVVFFVAGLLSMLYYYFMQLLTGNNNSSQESRK
ncbi:MAG: hypothetical protein RL021_378 [Bacteroidota bacterium]|jgi:hypothetical protein